MTDIRGFTVQAKLKSGVLKKNIPFFEGPIYYINAELFYNNNNIVEKQLEIIGCSKVLFDERIKPGLYCKVEITSEFILLNITFE